MKVVKNIVRVVLYATGALVVLLLLLAAVTQTQFFRDRLRTVALEQLDSVFAARVELGSITGNLVTGFSIEGVHIILGPDTLLAANQVGLRYNIFELPGRTISVHSLVLDRPVVRMLRSRAGQWSTDAMLRPTSPDSSSAPFDWLVRVQRLELVEGTLIVIDSTTLDEPEEPGRSPHAIDYDRLRLDDLSLALSFRMERRSYHAQIMRLVATVAGTSIQVRHLSGVFDLDASSARVTDLRVMTDSSHLQLDAGMFGVDLLAGVDLRGLETCSTAVDLRADPISFYELGDLLPATQILAGRAVVSLQADGPFGSLPVSTLDLQFGESHILLDGRVSNLHHPADLFLDVRIHESRIHPADPLALLPGLGLPDFSSMGAVMMDAGFTGTPLDFRLKADFESEAGSIRTENLMLHIGGPRTLAYKGQLDLRDVNLAGLFGQPGVPTRLNGSVVIEGSGVAIGKLDATMDLKLDSSVFRTLPLRDAQAHVRALGPRVDGSLQFGAGEALTHLTAGLDESDPHHPVFYAEGTASKVNLAELLDEPYHESDLNMDIRVKGSGLTAETLEGDFFFAVTSSRYRNYEIKDGDIHLSLDQSDSLRKILNLSSPLVDATMKGAFSFDFLQRLVDFEIKNARYLISENFARFDSLFASQVDTLELDRLRAALERDDQSVECSYSIDVKDLHLVSLIAGGRTFDGSATIGGTLSGSIRSLTYDTNVSVKEFFYGDVESGLLIEDGVCRIRAVDLPPMRSYTDADLNVQATAGRVDISSTELDSVLVDVRIKDRHAEYLMNGALNQRLHLNVQGEARLQEDTIMCRVDSFRAAYHEFAWEADPGVQINISREKIRIAGLTVRRGPASIFTAGVLGIDGSVSGTLKAENLNLGDLQYITNGEDATSAEEAFTGILAASLDVRGSLETPQIEASFTADSLGLQGIIFGSMTGTLGYHDGQLEISSRADVPNGRVPDGPELTIDGTLPMTLGNRPASSDGGFFNLAIHSVGTPITILDPLLPSFNQLTGMLTCDLTITGSADYPRYAGTLQLDDAGFLFEANNMYYRIDGLFAAEGERISIQHAALRNLPGDEHGEEPGLVNLTGDFRLHNFIPGDFNLSATGQLHVVKEATRKSALSMYGDLFVQIGPNGLHFTGSIERSLLKGDIIIRNSTLIFPPTQQVAAEESALSVPIILYDDTTKYGEKSVLSAADRYFRTIQNGGGGRPFKEIAGSVSFLDGLRYDLDIDATGGSTEIRMIFNPISSEELVATIDGRFSITGDGRRWLGVLEISRAYYNFYRRFDAEGRIQFTGDFMNPELDIQATYRGTRAVRDSVVGDKDERVVVIVDIKGPRNAATISMSMTIDDVDYYAYRGLKSNDVQSDALGFIIYGSFPLTMAEKGEVSAEVERTFRRSILTGASSLLTGTLSEFLRAQTGFISSVELNFNSQSGTTESADIRLSGVAWSGYWRYGGQILDDPLGNANFSVLYSFGSIFNKPSLRNLMMELESKLERGTFGQAMDLKRINSARLFYRFSF